MRGKIHLRWQSSPPQFTGLNVPYNVESYVNTHLSVLEVLDQFYTHNLIINLIISLLHLKISSFICLLCQQMAQDTLYTKPYSPSERWVCSTRISLFHNIRSFDHKCIYVGVNYQVPRFCSPRDYQATRWIASASLHQRVASGIFFWKLRFWKQSWAGLWKAHRRGLRILSVNGGI